MRASRQAGISLTELLIAMALGMFLTAAVLRIYAQVIAARNTTESLADLEERAAFALTELERDIRLAGYWGRHRSGADIDPSSAAPVYCGGADVTAWTLQLSESIAPANGLPCPVHGGLAANSDILVIRHASANQTNPRAGSLQLAASTQTAKLFSDGEAVATAAQRIHDLRVHGWYVDTQSSETGMPALRRITLVHGHKLQNQEIIPGVEQLTVKFGVDTNADQVPDRLLASQDMSSLAPAARVVAVHVEIAVRSSVYDASAADADGFRRLSVRRLLKLRNTRPG